MDLEEGVEIEEEDLEEGVVETEEDVEGLVVEGVETEEAAAWVEQDQETPDLVTGCVKIKAVETLTLPGGKSAINARLPMETTPALLMVVGFVEVVVMMEAEGVGLEVVEGVVGMEEEEVVVALTKLSSRMC